MTEQQTKKTLALVCALLLFFSLTAAVPDIQPHKTDTPPEIDGILDDACWTAAARVNNLQQAIDRTTQAEQSLFTERYDYLIRWAELEERVGPALADAALASAGSP